MNDQLPAPMTSERVPAETSWSAASVPASVAWASAESEEGTSIRSYLVAVYRRKWLILLAGVLGAGAAYIPWSRYQPTYVARSSVWVQGQGGAQPEGPIAAGGILPAESWIELLQSFALLEPVVVGQRLFVRTALPEDAELFGDVEMVGELDTGGYLLRVSEDGRTVSLMRGETTIEQGSPGYTFGAPLGLRWTPPAEALTPGREVAFSLISVQNAALALRSRLNRQMDQRGGAFINLELSGREPDQVAVTLNAIMDRYVQLAADLKTANLDEEHAILEQQLDIARSELNTAEQALETFRVGTITLPSDRPIQAGLQMTMNPVFDEFFQMRIRREDVRRDRERLEAVAREAATSGIRIEALEVIPAVGNSSELQEAVGTLVNARAEHRALQERYTEEHPSVQAVVARIRGLEEERIPSLISQLVQQLQIEEGLLDEDIASSQSDLVSIPERAIQETQLSRRVQIAEAFYTNVQNRYQVANLVRASSVPDVRILDRAVAPEYSVGGSQRVGTAALVFFLFLAAGLAGAILLDKMDSSVRTPDEISAAFGLTVLGAVPRIERVNGHRKSRDIRNLGQVYEAFRELRTNLIYAYGKAGPIVLTVSSPGMAEGKTTIGTNLGIAFAELGRRTLLIDADTRRGDMHHFLDGQRKPGLTDYLSMKASGSDVLQPTSHEGLDFIGSGTQVANSPELLASSEMAQMMSALREEYEVIIVDSPPLGAGADPLVLATITGHLLMVMRSGSTNREFTQAKLGPLGRLPVRMLGAVMNDYEPSRVGEGYQYYAAYLPGYEAGAEDEEFEVGEEVAPPLAAAAGSRPRFGGTPV